MINPASPLPSSLVSRYHGWRATSFQENKAWYARLAEGGQHPRTMIISCCDSRVHATTILVLILVIFLYIEILLI